MTSSTPTEVAAGASGRANPNREQRHSLAGIAVKERAAEHHTPRPYVGSETGTLKRVIVHRPSRMSFKARAQGEESSLLAEICREHDAFVSVLRGYGARVYYLQDLLAETLEQDEARRNLVRGTIRSACLGPRAETELAEWLEELPTNEVAEQLLCGLTYDEVPFEVDPLVASVEGSRGTIVPPLYEHTFTHESSVWIYGGVAIYASGDRAQRLRAMQLEAIYRYHNLFSGSDCEIWNDRLPYDLQLGRSEILVPGGGCVLVIMGEGARPGAVESLADRLFRAGAAAEVIAVLLPPRLAMVHQEPVLTMVDTTTFTIYPNVRGALRGYRLRPGPKGLSIEQAENLFHAIEQALDLGSLRLVETYSSNLLPIAPGVVAAYDRNAHDNSVLRDTGIEVIAVPGGALERSSSGPRSLACPFERAEPLD